jgi:DNA-binding HxlR family transcriptional regulator
MADAAKLLGDSWTLLILREVFYGVTRFDDLRAELGVSSATLSNRIAKLLELGLLEKQLYRLDNSRPRSEYLLTEAGRGFGPVLLAMMQWADTYIGKQPSPLDMVDPQTGNRLHLALVDEQGEITDWNEAVPVVRTDLIAQD